MFFLDFKDLMEVRIVMALRKRSFSLQKIRRAINIVKVHYPDETHPLVSGRVLMEGRQYLHVNVPKSVRKTGAVENVDSGQHAWTELLNLEDVRETIQSALQVLGDVEFDDDGPGMRWVPMKDLAPSIVLDPAYEFGQPIIRRRSLPTSMVVGLLKTYPKRELAEAYDLNELEIDHAVMFEREHGLDMAGHA